MAETRPLTRRELFRISAAGGIAAAAGWHAGLRLGEAQTPPARTPKEALDALKAGNYRYAQRPGTTTSLSPAKMKEIRKATETSQAPFAAVLCCADSRVPPELVFDQTIGQVFVVRVAGNIVTPDSLASLEYAVTMLPKPDNLSVRLIMVLGHADCGAVSAAVDVKTAPGQISALYPPIRAVIGSARGEAAEKANAKAQALLIRQASTVVKNRLTPPDQPGGLDVVAAYYNVATGEVSPVPLT